MRHHQHHDRQEPILRRAVVIPPAGNAMTWLAVLVAGLIAAIAGIGWVSARFDAERRARDLESRIAKLAEDRLESYMAVACSCEIVLDAADR
jgi:hypothetical protein